jgi:cytidine deaminase
MKKKYFHEVIEEEQKILDIGLKQSRLNKKERTKEKTLHELLMEGFEEEQRQRELEEEDE